MLLLKNSCYRSAATTFKFNKISYTVGVNTCTILHRNVTTKFSPFNPIKLNNILDGRTVLGSFAIIRLGNKTIPKTIFLYISNTNNVIEE
jgi:hypothetical protein